MNDSKLYTYDGENRMKTVMLGNNGMAFYYDYAGRCYKKNTLTKGADGVVTESPREFAVYDRTKQIMVLNGSGAVSDRYVWQPESSGDADVILWESGHYFATDFNKNVRVMYGPAGAVTDTYDYAPNGALLSAELRPRFEFSSEETLPAFGLVLYLYRAYKYSIRSWTTRDPINGKGREPLPSSHTGHPMDKWGISICSVSYTRNGDFNADLYRILCSKYVPDDNANKQKAAAEKMLRKFGYLTCTK